MKKVTSNSSVRSVRKPIPLKRKLDTRRECSTQTDPDKEDIDLISADEPPPKYWKMLAEKRQKLVEELSLENEKLQEKIEILETENRVLESMLEDAKQLAEFVSALPDDQDESGIERDTDDDGGSSYRR